MTTENIITTRFRVSRIRRIVFFEVNIPKEAKHIIAVETQAKLLSGTLPAIASPSVWELPTSPRRNLLFGELRLQSYESANLFYSCEIKQDNNADAWDFTGAFFTPRNYTHQGKALPDPIKVSGKSSVIKGVFRDKLAESIETEFNYIVEMFLWTDSKE